MSDTTLIQRLRESADEVMSAPHPSHCDHLHSAFHVMRQAADALEQQAAQIEAKDHQLRAAKTIIAGLEERVLSLSQITGPMTQAAADVAGERAANALLTSEVEALRADAERYRWLRMRDWFDSELCVLRDPKRVLTEGIGLGADCPSLSRLDAAIDAALRQEQEGTNG